MAWFRNRKKQPDAPDRKLVEAFAEPRERRYPKIFVGREAEVDLVERICRESLELVREGRKCEGSTVLFQGAPGAGKSALLTRLQKLWNGRRGSPVALVLKAGALRDAAKTARRIAGSIDPDKAERLFQWTGDAQGEVSTSREAGAVDPGFGRLKEIRPPEKWDRPLCILIDEIQNVGTDQRNCLDELHSGNHMLPIVPIFAGLASSKTALDRAGLGRIQIANMRTLERLPDAGVRAYVEGMLDLCRIGCSPADLERIAGGIAKSSEGWPQHVHTDTAALFRGLSQAGCDLSRVDFEAVEKQARSYREASCKARLSDEMAAAIHLAAAVLEKVPGSGLSRGKALEAIEAAALPGASPEWRLPEGMTAMDFLEHMIHKGFLQPSGAAGLACPIPSLQAWLIEQSRLLRVA